MFTSNGILIYNPDRKKIKENWRCIVSIHNDLTRYYRCLIKKHTGYILNEPSWYSHITVINKEVPTIPHMWNKHNKQKINFLYDPHIRYSGDTKSHKYIGKYWFIDVYSEELNNIREELGLPKKQNSRFHLTVGTLY